MILAPSTLSESAAAVCIISVLLTPMAAAALGLINAGLSRSRNAAHSIAAALFVFATATIVFSIVGCAWLGHPGGPGYAWIVRGVSWNWIGAEPFFLRGIARIELPGALALAFQVFAVGVAAVIPTGSGAERWRVGSACASTALFAGFTYPLFAHWIWGGGWLAQLGENIGLGQGLIDAGGSGAIHLTGGLTALAVVWILGPRRGKFTHEGMPTAMPGHNGILVLFGCLVALVGWLGLNTAGALLFMGAEVSRTPVIAINTVLGAATAALTAAAITRARFGRPDASLCANGWLGGLVAGSAGCASLAPAAAIAVGLVAGALVTLSIEYLESLIGIDDPGGSISVHALSGLWGLFAVGLLAGGGQWLAQLIGIASLIGFVFPVTYGMNWALDRFSPQRTVAEGERQGMDLYELGAGAYPEFVTHSGDFNQI